MATDDLETERVPGVVSRDPRTRHHSRKTSDCQPSPRLTIPQMEQRQRGMRPVHGGPSRRQQRRDRRSSESAVFPPIQISTMPKPGPSPTHEANLASSPSSNLSFQAATSIAEEDGVFSGFHVLSYSDREGRSPPNRRDAQFMLSVVENADTPRLSPIAGPEQTGNKPDGRVMRSVNGVILHDTRLDSKTQTGLAAADRNMAPGIYGQTARGKPSRRISMQSLPKLCDGEEPFSIRRKIEQFRKWHEEQYTDKLKKLKIDSEREKTQQINPRHSQSLAEIDFAKMLEDNCKDSVITPRRAAVKKDIDDNYITPSLPRFPAVHNANKDSTSKRCKSAATWKTWRDVNDSYAYNDVGRYIEENELLPKERVDWIKAWLGEVQKAMCGKHATDKPGNHENCSGLFSPLM